ncbi:MAG: hypothetical protein EPO62_00515 [Candidatus Nitrosotenuis sp.]|nr:MAG: hypothetical protein EPO62_00515 [Candidatus Nitrosotenuis sp.]
MNATIGVFLGLILISSMFTSNAFALTNKEIGNDALTKDTKYTKCLKDISKNKHLSPQMKRTKKAACDYDAGIDKMSTTSLLKKPRFAFMESPSTPPQIQSKPIPSTSKQSIDKQPEVKLPVIKVPHK